MDLRPTTAGCATQQAAGRPLVRFGDIPLDWTDFRLTLRQTADILHRFDALERAEYEQIVALARDGNALEPLVSQWYDATSGVEDGDAAAALPEGAPASLDQVLVLALRPFLARCAEALHAARRSRPAGTTATARSAAGSRTSR